jgi:hypothetical protein
MIDSHIPWRKAWNAPEHNWLNRSLPMKSVPKRCWEEGDEYFLLSGSIPYMGWYISSIAGRTKDTAASTKNPAQTAMPIFSKVPIIHFNGSEGIKMFLGKIACG